MKKKKSAPRSSSAQFVAIIVLTISIFLIIDLGRRAATNYRVHREAERLSQEVELAKQQQQLLLAQRSYVASDLYVEEVARRELKWARPGETVVVVMATPEAATKSTTEGPEVINVSPIAQTPAEAWWFLFFGPRLSDPSS
ncbi:MAG: septum formation initiator family protein [Chloroflexota bacterium]